ncbi:MAG: hypothetical protein ACK5JT_16615 [Hyphomicrobiaceae bacterium]
MALPEHIRFLALNALGGAVAGNVAAGLMLWFDAGGLGTLISESSAPVAPLCLLFGGFTLTFASLAMGSAIMLMSRDD